MKKSPLFWPVRLRTNTIYCLDETALPNKLVYLKVRDLSGAQRLIKKMKTRAFGQILMTYYVFLLLLKKNRNLKPQRQINILQKAAQGINKSRPTLPFSYFTSMILSWAKEARTRKVDIFPYTKIRIEKFLSFLKERRILQAKKLAHLIKNGDSILTHCNVSGSLVLAAQMSKEKNKKIKFFVTETRPYLQGARLTAWELKRAGFDVTVILDSAVAWAMSKGLINLVVVGADQMAQNKDIANKIGTYQIALLARHFNIPFYVLSPPASLARTKDDIKIEIRPDKEMLEFNGKRIAPKKVKGLYPAFDLTPHNLITKNIKMDL